MVNIGLRKIKVLIFASLITRDNNHGGMKNLEGLVMVD